MERLMRSHRIFWRSERLLAEHQLRLGTQRVQFNALAALLALIGVVMLSIAAFFALVPYWGHALAALTIGGADLVLAAVLVAFARSLQPATEIEMVKEVRNMALYDVEQEIALAEAELVAMKDDVVKFIRNPVDALLPAAIGPLFGAVARGLGSTKKK